MASWLAGYGYDQIQTTPPLLLSGIRETERCLTSPHVIVSFTTTTKEIMNIDTALFNDLVRNYADENRLTVPTYDADAIVDAINDRPAYTRPANFGYLSGWEQDELHLDDLSLSIEVAIRSLFGRN